MLFVDWNLNFTLMSPYMFIESYLTFGHFVPQECDKNGDEINGISLEISRNVYKNLDELISRRVSLRYMPGLNGSKMAAFVLYKTRQESIQRKKRTWMGEVWPEVL